MRFQLSCSGKFVSSEKKIFDIRNNIIPIAEWIANIPNVVLNPGARSYFTTQENFAIENCTRARCSPLRNKREITQSRTTTMAMKTSDICIFSKQNQWFLRVLVAPHERFFFLFWHIYFTSPTKSCRGRRYLKLKGHFSSKFLTRSC